MEQKNQVTATHVDQSENVQPTNSRVTVKLFGQLSPDGKMKQRAEVRRGKQEKPGIRMSLDEYKRFNKHV